MKRRQRTRGGSARAKEEGKKEMTEVERIDDEIARWGARRNETVTALARAREAHGTAEDARKRLLFAAHGEGDAKARGQLAAATERVTAAEREARDLAEVVGQIDAKVVELGHAQQAARRAEALGQLRDMAARRLALAADIEAALQDLLSKIEEYLPLSLEMATVGGRYDLRPPDAPHASALRQRIALEAHVGRQLYLRGVNVGNGMINLNVSIGGLLENEQALLSPLLDGTVTPKPDAAAA